MKYSYTDYARLDPAKRRDFISGLVNSNQLLEKTQQVGFLSEVYRSDPDSDIRQLADEKLKQLGFNMTEHLKTPDQKLNDLGGVNGRVYDRSELLSQSPYLFSPRSSRAYLSGETSQIVPEGTSPSRSLFWVGLFTLVVGMIVAFFAVYLHSLPLDFALVCAMFIIVFDVVSVIVYLIRRLPYQQKRERYARLSDTGKLLVGRIIDTSYEYTGAWKSKSGWQRFISYGFQTPENKPIVSERKITKKQWHEADRGTSVAVLYADDNVYEIL